MNEEMRKEFEAKMSDLGFGEHNKHDFDISEETGDYIDPDLNAMKAGFLIGWQASREAMKPICLSMWCTVGEDSDKYLLKYEVIEAIQQAGYKVEE